MLVDGKLTLYFVDEVLIYKRQLGFQAHILIGPYSCKSVVNALGLEILLLISAVHGFRFNLLSLKFFALNLCFILLKISFIRFKASLSGRREFVQFLPDSFPRSKIKRAVLNF
ncbi:hypothetical protein L1887_12364 [Cichorium endivia]|nr:hypothetical protein L1887_12364 [Cichorium endivia]